MEKLKKSELFEKCIQLKIKCKKSSTKEELVALLKNYDTINSIINNDYKKDEYKQTTLNFVSEEQNDKKEVSEKNIKNNNDIIFEIVDDNDDNNSIISDNNIDNNNIKQFVELNDGLLVDSDKIKLYKGDCLQMLDNVEDKSIQLICIDPPYNIGKDTWDNIENYNSFMMTIIKKLEKKLKDNGSFFMFHNDMEMISELMVHIKKETKFIFKQMIVWNKRFDGSSKKGFMDGFVVKNDMHNFNKMAEYILFYTFDNSYKMEQRRKELNVSQLTISQEIKSKTGGLTGWYSNLETGKNMPTRETIKPIEKHLGLKYEDIVPKFINMKTDHSVWNYDMAKRCKVHITPKPVDLLKNIIYHTTDEGDIILDCFGGSGSMGYAALETNRKCILIEKESKYCSYIKDEIKKY
jgi:site-specific DNA-methyltransferase (adenine-specific)